MPFNIYSIRCCEESFPLDLKHNHFALSWDKTRFERPTARFQELVPTYFQVLFRKWAVRDVTTPNTYEKSGMWGREFSGFRIPETVKEEFDILWENNQIKWNQLPEPQYMRPPWKNPFAIKELIFPSYGIIDHETLRTLKVDRDPRSPNYTGYSLSKNDQREIDYTVTIMANQG